MLAAIEGIEVLHDRLVPGKGKADIDHLVVGPSGVYVIDAKRARVSSLSKHPQRC